MSWSKGVAALTNPSTGVYCIKPKRRTKIDVTRIVPALTAEWDGSTGNALMAYWIKSGAGCAAGRIAVATVNGTDGTFGISNDVAFAIIVP